MKKIVIVFGTRPEAIKMCPLVLELKKRKAIQTIVCVTAQHRQMLDQVLTIFGVTPDYDLDIMTKGCGIAVRISNCNKAITPLFVTLNTEDSPLDRFEAILSLPEEYREQILYMLKDYFK